MQIATELATLPEDPQEIVENEVKEVREPESETEKGLTAMYDLGVKHGREQALCDMRSALSTLWSPEINK
jgi:hypothetical protein